MSTTYPSDLSDAEQRTALFTLSHCKTRSQSGSRLWITTPTGLTFITISVTQNEGVS